MADTGPPYFLRYQLISDSPHGPNLGLQLATDVHNKFLNIDGRLNAAAVGGEYQASVGQSISATGLNKITLGATVQAANGITWNGTNQFTVVTAGVYALFGQNYIVSGTANFATLIGTATATLSSGIWVYGNFTTTGISAHACAVRFLAAGSTVCLYTYNNNQPFTTSVSPGPSVLSVWRLSTAN